MAAGVPAGCIRWARCTCHRRPWRPSSEIPAAPVTDFTLEAIPRRKTSPESTAARSRDPWLFSRLVRRGALWTENGSTRHNRPRRASAWVGAREPATDFVTEVRDDAARLRRQNRRRRRAIVRRGRDRVVGRRPSGAGARSGSLPKVRGGSGARDDAWPPRWVAAPHRTQSASLPPPFVAARTPSATRLSGHLEGSPRPAPVGRAGRRGPRAPREAAARAILPWRKWQIV